MQLTNNQHQAIERLDGSVSVSAGAGSGKTEVLVRRFCHIVESGKAGVGEILTVTFTEKGALEMKSRIMRRFADSGRTDLMHAVGAAYIGTIHAFCKRVLSENPFAAGVDPRFSVLNDAEQRAMSLRIVDETLEARGDDERTLALLREIGVEQVRSSVLSVYGHTRSLGLPVSPALLPTPTDPIPLLHDFEARLRELVDAAQSPTESLARVMDGILAGMEDALAAAQRLAEGGEISWEDVERVKDFVGLFKANVGSKPVKQAMVAARDALSALISAALDPSAIEISTRILDLIADFDLRYSDAKRKLGVLDYDDLLLKTLRLFIDGEGHPTETALQYRDRFRFVTLDEFQDTNRLQKRIIDAISRPGNVFTVGDVKQSIFSFIHSDVEVFRSHHEAVRTGDGTTIPFQENFRSSQGIIDFVNRFFERLWAEDDDFEFEPLLCEGEFTPKAMPDVDALITPRGSADSDETGAEVARRNEAMAIAGRVLEMVSGEGASEVRRTKGGSAGRAVELRDIIVLLRSTSSLAIYERALEECGIDTYVVSGRGFYGTQEIQDILSLLQAVDNPLNDIAMAAALRSPFVGVTEDALFWLTRDWQAAVSDRSGDDVTKAEHAPPMNPRPGKFWESIAALERITVLSDADRARLLAFRDVLRELIATRSHPMVSRALDIAFERTRFRTKLLAMPGGRRRYANVRKLHEIARDFEAKGLLGLSYFITYLRDMGELAEREAQAPTESETGNAVRIMTIHKAKGLQAPVVFLADMSRKPNQSQEYLLFDPEIGLTAKLRNPLDYELEAPECFSRANQKQRQRSIAEDKRLLYVAMTRAEEHLVLVGSSDLKGSPKPTYRETPTWCGWIEKALQLGSDTPDGIVGIDGARALFTRGSSPPTVAASDARRSELADALAQGRRIEHAASPETCALVESVVERCLRDDRPRTKSGVRLTVSQMLDYLECPRRYKLIHLLGMPDEGAEYGEGDSDEATFSSSADLGKLVHDILARIDFTRPPHAQLERLVSREQDGALRSSARTILERFARSDWYGIVGDAHGVLKEMPFEIAVDHHALVGRIDLVFRDARGWTVMDYKTGSMGTDERHERQIGAYTLAASKLLGEMPVRAGLLLLASDRARTMEIADDSQARAAASSVRQAADGISGECFEPITGRHCDWCVGRLQCPKGTCWYGCG